MFKNYSFDSKAGIINRKAILILSFIFSVLITQNIALAQDAGDGIPSDEAVIANGSKLFNANCTVCHAINEKVVGPALRNVHQRRDVAWITAFVQNSQKVIKSGDPYAVKLYNDFNKTEMTSFDFKDEEILSIIAYIKLESSKEAVTATAATTAGTDTTVAGNQEPSQFVNIVMIIMFVVLVLILAVLAMIISLVKKFISQKDNIEEDDQEIAAQNLDIMKLVKSNAFLGLVSR
jgi:cytochrome c2